MRIHRHDSDEMRSIATISNGRSDLDGGERGGREEINYGMVFITVISLSPVELCNSS